VKNFTHQVNYPPVAHAPDVDWSKAGRIPIDRNDEPLVQVCPGPSLISVIPSYANQGIPGAINSCYVRQGVYNRLLNVARALPSGYRLVVLDGWRPFCVQQYLFDALLESIRASHPEFNETELRNRTLEFVCLPTREEDSPSSHLTGGAVDVTLSDADGQLLDMHTQFDEAIPESYTVFLEGLEKLELKERRARDNRRLLYWAMLEQGFTNLTSEWWHYDFGDQLWAYYSGNKRAFYGVAKPDND
jgi:D-alanyl-D-alanine dipeptidase